MPSNLNPTQLAPHIFKLDDNFSLRYNPACEDSRMNMNAAMAIFAFIVMSAAAQSLTPKAAKPIADAKADDPSFKAIWEPVPYNKDINLNAIACVGPETCWVVGDKSTIIATTDGGKSWQVQLGGDPDSTNDSLTKIFILDAKQG